jgi:hypothetical protein
MEYVGLKDTKDSHWVITGAYDGTVRLWRLNLSDLDEIACQTAGRDLTPEEAKVFFGDQDARKPCTDKQTMQQSSSK